MDFRFYYNERQLPCAQLSMDHEAFGLWLTDEISDDQTNLSAVLAAVDAILNGQRSDYEAQGHDFTLLLSRDDARVIANTLLDDHTAEELQDEDLDIYDAESHAECGLEDFRDLLIEWRDFLED